MILFVLGLDGLDYDLVHKWKCCELQQAFCGRLLVPLHPVLGVPKSSMVWACFLTGDWEGCVKYADFTYGSLNRDRIYRVLMRVRSMLPFGLGLMKHFVEKKQFPKLVDETFVDRLNCGLINVPYYNFDPFPFSLHQQYASGTLNLAQVFHQGYQHLYHLQEMVLSHPHGAFTFAYFPFPDFMEHYRYRNVSHIQWLYGRLNFFVYKLKKQLDDNLLVVSDHGFNLEKGMHSMEGFYSFSKRLAVERISDFHNLLLQLHS